MTFDEKWEVRRPDGAVVKFTTAQIERYTKPRKFKQGTEQYQLAWRISHNIKEYKGAREAGHDANSLRQQILDELGQLVALGYWPLRDRQAESRSG